MIPFASYASKNVTSGKPGGSSKIGNIGAGLLSDFTPVVGGYYQNFQLFGQYLHSYVTDTDLVSANAVYTPDFFFPVSGPHTRRRVVLLHFSSNRRRNLSMERS